MATDIPPGERMTRRFWAKVDTSGGPDACWPWVGYTAKNGYGQFRVGSEKDGSARAAYAHRVAWELTFGQIPDGVEIDHVCHNVDSSCPGGKGCAHRRCCNPRHMEPTSHETNTMRGRAFSAVNARKTHCPKGHRYDHVERCSGTRRCSTCRNEQYRRRYAAKKVA